MAPETPGEPEPRWGGAYLVVLGVLAVEVVLLALMSWSYR
jgi:hypothetical protein